MAALELDLQSRLEIWTRRAVKRVMCAATASQGACIDVGECLSKLTSVLNARRGCGCGLLSNVPRAVISGICAHLSLWDIMQLSLTSRGMRATLLAIPEVWSTLCLPAHERGWDPVLISSDQLAPFLARSAPAALDLRLDLMPYLLPEQAPILASHINRTTRLRITLYNDTSEDNATFWTPLFRDGLSESAPLLTTLEIESGVMETAEVVYPRRRSARVTIFHPLFSGFAPRLRTCRLTNISLPPNALCRALRNVTRFAYTPRGYLELRDLARILAIMPQLESLQLNAFFGAPSGNSEPTAAFPLASSLRELMLHMSFRHIDLAAVGRVVPLGQLRELRIETDQSAPFHAIAEAYPGIDSLCLLIRQGCPTGCLTSRAGGVTTDITFNWGLGLARTARLADFCTPYPNLTCLEIHEFFWNHDTFGPPPALPNLTILCVHLARRTDYSAQWPLQKSLKLQCWHTWEALGIVPDQDEPVWSLPALREVHVTAAWGADLDAEVQAICESQSLPMGIRGTPMSVSLRDVACWVRDGMAFKAAKLEVIGLSGLQAINFDFAVAWEELMALTMSVQMTETPGRPFCLATGPRGYHEHSLSTRWSSD